MSLIIETVAATRCATGENPLWHPGEKCLYWTDIPAGRLYRFDPSTGRHALCYRDRPVGGFTLQADGSLLLFRDCGNVVRFKGDRILETVIESIPDLENTRFNDVIADPAGRVFAGTMSWGEGNNGRLYRIERDASWHRIGEGYRTPNGMGFSADQRTMFFTDSGAARIYRFAYDRATGHLDQRTLLIQTSAEEAATLGRSDGMTIDREGYIWSARWDGGQIIRYHSEGRMVDRIPMPARKISSVAFGGNDWGDLYATSAGGNAQDPDDPLAGALFRLRPGVRGRPEYRSRIGD